MSQLPAIAYLDGPRIATALRVGIHQLLLDQEYLNTINVFPVPDGDTGTNLALTLGTILSALSGSTERNAGRVLATVADAALDGSRGNSGAIMAQFFQGLADELADGERITPARLVSALLAAARYSRDALAEPVEGTLVTVISDVARAVQDPGLINDDFVNVVRIMAVEAARSRDRTTQQLEALRKAQVVDAGAAGFADLLQGMHEFVEAGSLRSMPDDSAVAVQHGFEAMPGDVQNLRWRYCTECMITGDGIDRRKLRDRLGAFGDSLVVAGTHNKIKLHIHTDDPGAVFAAAGRYGSVSAQKADDMRSQQEAGHQTRRRVAVLIDSAADVADEELERLHIHTAPLRVHFGDRGYLDKVSISTDDFYRLLRNGKHQPTTSQPSPGDLRRQYEFLASHFDGVVSLHLGAVNSGTFQAAQAAAERCSAAERVQVVDTLNASLGQGLIAMRAAECAQAGHDLGEVLAAVREVIPRTRTYAALGDLSFAVRGGRIPAIVKTITGLLNLTPVLGTRASGRVALAGVLFGRRNVERKFVRFVLRRMSPERRYRVAAGFGADRGAGESLLARLRSAAPNISGSWLAQVGSALGAHAGPGVLLIAFQDVSGLQAADASGTEGHTGPPAAPSSG